MTIQHKKIILLLITSMVVLGAILSLAHYQKSEKADYSKEEIDVAEETFRQITEKDTDKDALKDWEEALWKSDPQNTDTDGDGTPDGEEVKTGRNPIVKGPADKILETAKLAGASSSPENLTDTARFARDFFTKYMTYKQSGVPITPENQAELVNAILDEIPELPFTKKYATKDIKTHNDNSSQAIRIYGNTLGTIITTYLIKSENEGVIAKRSMENEDPEEIKKLDPIIQSYRTILQKLSAIPVPSGATSLHVALLNRFSDTIVLIQGLRAIHTDPFRALQSLSVYQKNTEDLLRAFTDLKNYFILNDVIFELTEAGIIFTPHQ